MNVVPAAAVAKPVIRISTVLTTVTVAAVVALARHPLEAMITIILVAVVFSGLLYAFTQRRSQPAEPIVVTIDQLPPTRSTPRTVLYSAACLAVYDTAVAAFTLLLQPQAYGITGIAASVPLTLLATSRRMRHVEHDRHGTLWIMTRVAWASNTKARYIVIDP